MFLAAGFLFVASMQAAGQQGTPAPVNCAHPRDAAEEQFCAKSRAYQANRPKLQAEAKGIVAAETGRDTGKDCPAAQTTVDFNTCFGSVLKTAEKDLGRLEGIIRELEAIPQEPGAPSANPVGPGGVELTPAQTLAEFDQVEASWRTYVGTACRAAFHEMGGGTGGPSFELECQIRLTRDHMRALDTIYGMELHL